MVNQRLLLACTFACLGLTGEALAQSPPAETISSIERRLEALERENAAMRAQNARLEGLITINMVDSPAEPALAANGTGAAPNESYYLSVPKNTASEPCDAPKATEGALSELIEGLGTRYDNGFVLVDTPDPSSQPYKLWFNLFNQFRYLNQELDSRTFTDHLGNVRTVDARNDFNVNRNLFYFNGYVFDPKLVFSAIIWSSNSVATVVQGGYVSYEFDKCFKLYGGYYGIPGSRSNTRDFMFLPGVERSMADSFFRPGFTQAVWAEGTILDQVYYSAYVGNSMNTLGVSTSKIDKNFAYATSAWWEPLGDYGPPGAARMAYSDLEWHDSPVIRIGTSFIGAREDRFGNLSTNPENVAIYNSDGVLLFETGSLAPGVTVSLANYYMWAQDFGLKYRGLALNSQYYLRWVNSFRADGPLPISGTFDQGFEASLGYFICPKSFEIYGRTSAVFGEFRDSNEYAAGFNWHPWKNRGFRLIGEANHVDQSPTASIQTIYNAGMTGWNFVLQTQLYF
jgi:hypothetical protein